MVRPGWLTDRSVAGGCTENKVGHFVVVEAIPNQQTVELRMIEHLV